MKVKFLGVPLDITYEQDSKAIASYYDPETRTIVIADGVIAKAARKLMCRSDKWLMGHELGHAFLDQYGNKFRRQLKKVFGDLSEEAYQESGLMEFMASLSFQDDEFISARATLCPEEDLAECCAYLFQNNNRIGKSLPKIVKCKLKVVRQIIVGLRKDQG